MFFYDHGFDMYECNSYCRRWWSLLIVILMIRTVPCFMIVCWCQLSMNSWIVYIRVYWLCWIEFLTRDWFILLIMLWTTLSWVQHHTVFPNDLKFEIYNWMWLILYNCYKRRILYMNALSKCESTLFRVYFFILNTLVMPLIVREQLKLNVVCFVYAIPIVYEIFL